jgi:predicted transcriptional regulator
MSLTAPNYAQQRKNLAHKIGLVRKPEASAPKSAATAPVKQVGKPKVKAAA